jgi:hypothetical protein
MGGNLLEVLAFVGALVVLGLVCHLLEMVRLALLKAWQARKAARLLAQWRAEGRVAGLTRAEIEEWPRSPRGQEAARLIEEYRRSEHYRRSQHSDS